MELGRNMQDDELGGADGIDMGPGEPIKSPIRPSGPRPTLTLVWSREPKADQARHEPGIGA